MSVFSVSRLSCDRAVIAMLKERTLGNGVSRLRASLVEQHSRDWMQRSIAYLSVLRKLRGPGAAQKDDVSLPTFARCPGSPGLVGCTCWRP